MASINTGWLRRSLNIGTGPGIVIGDDALQVVLARLRPDGVRVLDSMTIEDFRNRPAAEWGAEYEAFLQRHSSAHQAAVAILPRRQVVVRTLMLPGVAGKDAESAIRFQLDTLHPFGDEEVSYDWKRLGSSAHFIVAIAERRIIDAYTALFYEAGVKLAGYTFSGGAVYSALRLYADPPADGFLAFIEEPNEAGAQVEVYGESATRPLLSAVLEEDSERVVTLMAAELRLPAETAALPLPDLLPAPKKAPEAFAVAQQALAYAAALDAACPHLAPVPNLLPAESRTSSSRAVYIPTAILAFFLALTVVGLLGQNRYLDAEYLDRLEQETRRLEPVARKVERMDKSMAEMSERIRMLDAYRGEAKRDLDVLLEIDKLMPPPAWAQQILLNRSEVMIGGESERAEDLLRRFDASPLFRDSQFTTPITRGVSGELFRMKTTREAGGK